MPKIPLFYGLLILLLSLSVSLPAAAADKENCLMCHKYRQLGRIDEKGRKISYFVSENIYNQTVHRNIPCRDCHTYITKLPHDPVTEEVNCSNECHVKPPFSQENFSHKKIVEAYNKSVHGIKPDDPPDVKQAKPYCKYCHQNPLFMKVDEKYIAGKTLLRCLNCHEREGVTKAYTHITHRLGHKTSRSPQEVVQLCSKNCHENVEMMKKFKVSKNTLEAVDTYNESIHGKAVVLGSEEAADCLSCHATHLIHDVQKKDDPESTINPKNLIKTCKQCHIKVNKHFIQIDVHSNVEENLLLHMINIGLTFALYGTFIGLVGLMLFETYGRKKDGIKWMLKKGTTWRGLSRRRPKD